MGEVGFIEDVIQYGPVYTALILLFWFLTYKLWPWYVGPRQDMFDNRWRVKLEQDNARDMQVKALTDRVIGLFEQHQDGEQARTREDHQRLEKAIFETHLSVMKALEGYAAVSKDREEQLEMWVKSAVSMAKIGD